MKINKLRKIRKKINKFLKKIQNICDTYQNVISAMSNLVMIILGVLTLTATIHFGTLSVNRGEIPNKDFRDMKIVESETIISNEKNSINSKKTSFQPYSEAKEVNSAELHEVELNFEFKFKSRK